MGNVSQLHANMERIASSPRIPTPQIYAVSKLIGYLEGLLTEGSFTDPKIEMEVRARVADTISAFGLQHHDTQLEGQLSLIREVMDRS